MEQPLTGEVALGRRGLRELAADAPTWFWLSALVALSALGRFLVALAAPAPWIFPDEWVYWELARSFGDSASFSIWGVAWPVRTSGPLYPVLISPLVSLAPSLEVAYVLVKALNAILMSLAAVPAYLLARRLAARPLAFFAAVLTLLVPSMVYTSKVMTENVSYPLFLLTALAFVRALERPTPARQTVALALVAVSFLARAEMAALIPVYLGAIVLLAFLDARSEGGAPLRRLAAYKTTWIAALAAGAAVLLGAILSGASLLGAYEELPGKIRLLSAPRWLLYQAAEVDLAVGVVPFAAFLLVVFVALRDRSLPRATRVFVAVAVPTVVCFLVLGGVYATQPRPLPHVFERYVFYVMPFLFVALALWIERGLPRPKPWVHIAAGCAILLPLALPLGTLLNGREWGVSSSTPGLVPWARLSEAFGTGWALRAAVLVAAGLLALLFLRIGRERESLLRFVTLCVLWMITLVVAVSDLSAAKLAGVRAGGEPGWVDDAVEPGSLVAVVWPALAPREERGLYAVLETQFFNRSVSRVYHVGAPIRPGVPSQPLPRKAPADVDYVVADAKTTRLPLFARQAGGSLGLFRVSP
jgi:hypothetical protein